MSESSQPAQVGSNAGLGLEPERADDEWTTAVWESWCDMPREGQSLKWHDLLMYGEACYAKAVAAERDRYAPLLQAVEWLLDDGHMDTGHLARLRAAFERA